MINQTRFLHDDEFKKLITKNGKVIYEKSEVLFAVERLKRAYKRLSEAVAIVEDDLDKDGVIQRFEFTVELLWKTLKIMLEYNKIDASGGPKLCVKEAFRYGYITDDEIILDMLDDRNISWHIYDDKASEEIFQRINDVYVKYLEKIINRIEEKIG